MQFEPGPGQGRKHCVDVEVVAGLAGCQAQVLLGVAEVELDLEAVAVDMVNPFRCHPRVGGEEGHRTDLLRIGVDIQHEDHAQQALEGLADQLRMVQPPALVRQVDGGQLGDAGAIEVVGVLARQAGVGRPQDGVTAQLADPGANPSFVQALNHGRTAVAGC